MIQGEEPEFANMITPTAWPQQGKGCGKGVPNAMAFGGITSQPPPYVTAQAFLPTQAAALGGRPGQQGAQQGWPSQPPAVPQPQQQRQQQPMFGSGPGGGGGGGGGGGPPDGDDGEYWGQ